MTIWSAGYRVRSITPLEEEKALKEGAEFVGETFILLVSGSWLVWEYNRGKEKERAKEQAKRAQAKAERDSLQAKLHTLDVRLKALESVVKANSQSILNLGSQRYVEPSSKDLVPIDDDELPEGKAKQQIVTRDSDNTLNGDQASVEVQPSGKLSKGRWWQWPPW